MTGLSTEFRVLQFPDWQGEFEAAVRENDPAKRFGRLQAENSYFLAVEDKNFPSTRNC